MNKGVSAWLSVELLMKSKVGGILSLLYIFECSLDCTVMFHHKNRPQGKDFDAGNLFRRLSQKA